MFEVTMKATEETLGITKIMITKEVTMKARVIMAMIVGIGNAHCSVFCCSLAFLRH
jgi:hypothetical protein